MEGRRRKDDEGEEIKNKGRGTCGQETVVEREERKKEEKREREKSEKKGRARSGGGRKNRENKSRAVERTDQLREWEVSFWCFRRTFFFIL